MNRKILYGYQIQDGKLEIQPQEAAVVKQIFVHCLTGKPQWKIAEALNDGGVIYSPERPEWNPYRISFILHNPRYMGGDDYPIIIDGDTFQTVRETLKKKSGEQLISTADRPVLRYRDKLRCGQCGGRLKRQFSGRKRKDTLYLQCEGCGIRLTITDAALLAEVERQMEAYTPPERDGAPYEPSGEVIRLTNAINRQLECPKQPEEVVRLILQGISARYDCLAPEPDRGLQDITIAADNAVTVAFKG